MVNSGWFRLKSSSIRSTVWLRNMDNHQGHGCETECFATSWYRIMLNIKRLEKVSNDRIYDHISTSPLLSTVILRQLKFFSHILRMEKDEPANIYALHDPSHRKRSPGRPRRSFLGQIQEWINPNKDKERVSKRLKKTWLRISLTAIFVITGIIIFVNPCVTCRAVSQ